MPGDAIRQRNSLANNRDRVTRRNQIVATSGHRGFKLNIAMSTVLHTAPACSQLGIYMMLTETSSYLYHRSPHLQDLGKIFKRFFKIFQVPPKLFKIPASMQRLGPKESTSTSASTKRISQFAIRMQISKLSSAERRSRFEWPNVSTPKCVNRAIWEAQINSGSFSSWATESLNDQNWTTRIEHSELSDLQLEV